jgi:hypothetical protein
LARGHRGLLIGAAVLVSQLQGEGQSSYDQVKIPAYHDAAPKTALPPVLSPDKVSGRLNKNAYSIASKISAVLYEQPCYCYCDRAQGHKSLHDCYTSEHATTCTVCQRELFYAYEQSQKGKTAAQIRKGIMAADWADIDLSKYAEPLK